MTTLERPSLQQYIDALALVQQRTAVTDPNERPLGFVISYGAQYGYYSQSYRAYLAGKASDEDFRRITSDVNRCIAHARVKHAGGSDKVLQQLHAFLLASEPCLRNVLDGPAFASYQLEGLASSLDLPREGTTISQIIAALCEPEAAELLQARASNDYWRLRILLAATSQNHYYFRGFPVTRRDMLQGIYRTRLALKVRWEPKCATDKAITPTLLDSITSGALLFRNADDQTLVNNPLLLDEAARIYVTVSSGHGSAYRFDGSDPFAPPAGPYQTLDEANADADAWAGYADTIGGSAYPYDVTKWQPGVKP